jgi:hypothetical protein
MTNIFNMGDMDEFTEKLNLDELYETKKQKDLNKLELYNRILNRVHNKIKHISRQRACEQHCWFLVPEMILGVPRYDNSDCIAYLVQKLRDNGFVVKYTHPNMLFISWQNWVPDYVRNEIKKKMNVNVDGHGNVVEKKTRDGDAKEVDFFGSKTNKHEESSANKDKTYKKIDSYKPSGNKVYSDIFLNFE